MENQPQSYIEYIHPSNKSPISQSANKYKIPIFILTIFIIVITIIFVSTQSSKTQKINQQLGITKSEITNSKITTNPTTIPIIITTGNISCTEVIKNNQNIEKVVLEILKKSGDISKNDTLNSKKLKLIGIDIFVNKSNIFIRWMGGEYEKIIKYTLNGKEINSCENTWWQLGDDSNPSCNIPLDSLWLNNCI